MKGISILMISIATMAQLGRSYMVGDSTATSTSTNDAEPPCGLDVCVALDISGSICTPDYMTTGHHCLFCHYKCHDPEYTLDICCSDFDEELLFAKEIAEYVSNEKPTSRFSLVTFSTEATPHTSGMVDKDSYLSAVDNLHYVGGWTNTGNAIQYCQNSLLSDDSPNEKVIVLVTDGLPSNGFPNKEPAHSQLHKAWASGKANVAKNLGIKMIPVLVHTSVTDLEYLESLASDPDSVTSVETFTELHDDLTDIIDMEEYPCGFNEPEDDHKPPECEYHPIDVCMALDMSGSVCSPEGVASNSCLDCNDHCFDQTFSEAVCCSNFDLTIKFAADMSKGITSAIPTARFSLVTFAIEAMTKTGLTDRDSFVSELGQMRYAGGWTNTGDAIKLCHDTLKDSPNHKVILLLTDGTPTNGNPDFEAGYIQSHKDFASEMADAVKNDGMTLIPVMVETSALDTTYLETLATNPDAVAAVDYYYQLDSELDKIAAMVKCY